MTEEEHKKSFWMTLPGILAGIAALITALVSAIALFQNGSNDQETRNVEKYYSYFIDLDKNIRYFSDDGVVELEINNINVKGQTTVKDLLIAGELSERSWNVIGYLRDNYLYLTYDTGVAILKNYYDDYIGHWIGENYDGMILKCPYVISKDRLTEKQAKGKWVILNQQCERWEVIK